MATGSGKSSESSMSKYSQYNVGFEHLLYLWQNDICLEMPPQRLQSFTFLRQLRIENCLNLVSFHKFCFLSSLTRLEIRNCHALTSLLEEMKHNNAHLEELIIDQCDSLTYITKGQPPPSLKNLDVRNCEKLECLLDDKEESCASSMLHKENIDNNTSTSLLEHLIIINCPSIMCLSSKGQLPATISYLHLQCCLQLTTLSSSGQLPQRLRVLNIMSNPMLESIAERFHINMSLESITFLCFDNLKYIPEGLHNLSCLRFFILQNCPAIVSFPAGGLPNTNLCVSIQDCEKLEALPDHFNSLDSLTGLDIFQSSSLKSFTEKGFPTNLTSLSVQDHNIYKALVDWGFHRLTSLTFFWVGGCLDAESFPQGRNGNVVALPASLLYLIIERFPKLKYLSDDGFRNLTYLKALRIQDCPNLKSFPERGLRSSLLKLDIERCSLLKEECKRIKERVAKDIPHPLCYDR